MKCYVAFLRGINVGGHHKVPMADLRKLLEKNGFERVKTLLNSGNVIFDHQEINTNELEEISSQLLEENFGFKVPTSIRSSDEIKELVESDPFQGKELSKEVRFYLSFLRADLQAELNIPWTSEDGSFKILEKKGRSIISILDLSIGNTPKAMEVLEKAYRKENITTRNWNTLLKIYDIIQTR